MVEVIAGKVNRTTESVYKQALRLGVTTGPGPARFSFTDEQKRKLNMIITYEKIVGREIAEEHGVSRKIIIKHLRESGERGR